MDYQEHYKRKLITPAEAVGLIRSGDMISAGFCGNEPFTFLSHLKDLKHKVTGVQTFTGLTLGKYDYMHDPSYRGIIDAISPFYSAQNRASHKLGQSTFFPGDLHNLPARWIEENPIRIFCCSATPMDRHGYFRLPLSQILERIYRQRAELVILEVNPNLPVVYGDTAVHISEIDYLIEGSTPVPQLPRPEIGPEEQAIGAHVATLVRDGDTIQLGIGSIPDAVAQAFGDKKELGIHTEMITSSMADLVELGVVTGMKKNLHKGKIIGSFIFGDQKLYDFVDGNPGVEIMSSAYVTDPQVVARNDNMVSINTGLAVDLTGQVASESIATVPHSGTGGQCDTAVGAIHAKNGRSIIALRSTAQKGKVSTISACLAPGTIVTLSRNSIDYIVTEYGVAQMRGRTVRQRAENLIAVAHPDFRQSLREDAVKYGFL